MTSDKDIELYVSQHYNPDIASPEEYMQSTNWGSGSRQAVAYKEAQRIYDDYLRNKGVSDEEIQEQKERLEAQEQQDIEENAQQQQNPEEDLEENENFFSRAGKYLYGILRGIFS